MKNKTKNFFWVASILAMVSPVVAFGALDWGIGLDSSGNWTAGVGSEGSGAGSFGSNGGFALPGSFGLPSGSILGIIQNLLFWLLTIFGLAGIIGFVISGMMYLVAAGDSGLIDRAKEGMKYSIIGIIVGLSGFIVLQAINAWLAGSKTF